MSKTTNGGILRVDSVYGNDTFASITGGGAYKTISAALAVATSGYTVNIMSGTYTETSVPLIIPTGVSVMGASRNTNVIISNVTTTTTVSNGNRYRIKSIIN